ncbi:MAG TPA: SagB family peptide dehydrogenase [Tepidisphaeraceae bacterium]
MGARLAPPEGADYVPNPVRVFLNHPKVALPTTLLDAPVGMLTLLNAGQDALPESLRAPPQDAKTLASWLYYAAGETKHAAGRHSTWNRPFPDADATFPFEIYVAAFAVKGIEPGLYHFCPREFALRRLREGAAPLLQIKRGRPDLEFLKTLPAAILVAANYWKAVYRYRRRAYRAMLIHAGQMVQNVISAGAGLGIQTVTRLRMNDSNMRELIGCPLDEPLATAESVLAMVAWADRAVAPIQIPAGAATVPMPAIVRPQLSVKVLEDEASTEPLFVHHDCVAPGVAVREIHPPLTELSPLPPQFRAARMPFDDDLEGSQGGLPVRAVMTERRSVLAMAKNHNIPRNALVAINRVAFRGGSFFPMFPDGPHVATIRPFWILHEVMGFDPGIWYYHPPADTWGILRPSAGQSRDGRFRREARYIAGDLDAFGDAAAVCVMTANLHALLTQGGPDAYRLAHLEAGIAAQRIYLAATALGLGTVVSQTYYDDDCRNFLALNKTGWEVLALVAIGRPGNPAAAQFDQQVNATAQTYFHHG